ncbi:MAG: hypothetical protein ACC645_22170 [Pirellulales bacterium]
MGHIQGIDPARHLGIATIVLWSAGSVVASNEPEIVYVVKDEAVHGIDPKLFGHFLERPSWGEVGVEGGLTPGTRQLQPSVLKRLREMGIPVLRFPGGTDVDYLDWRDMIDHVPGRAGERPVSIGHRGHQVTNEFGYDEFLHLCEELHSDAILVVNLADALLKKKSLKEAALHAAGLTAYCNAPPGAALPGGMPDWPAVRARNGRRKPYGVKYFQLGNETWFFVDRMRKQGNANPETFYVECLAAYVAAVRDVDPSVQILVDAVSPKIAGLIHERLGDQVNYLVQHHYMPWGIKNATRAGQTTPLTKLTDEEIWYAWVAIPNSRNAHGESVIDGVALSEGRKLGYKVAVTEWNWNGFYSNGDYGALPADQRPLNSSFAKGLGAAGYLHALMRAGDAIEIGCQSMTVGNRWGITSIRADRQGRVPAYFLPSGQVTMFYAKHHGNKLLSMTAGDVPTYEQPLRMGGIRPSAKVAHLDALATAGDHAVYFHVINRHFSESLTVHIDLSDFRSLSGKAVHHLLLGRLNDAPRQGESREIGRFEERKLSFKGSRFKAVLPARSLSCIEIQRSRKGVRDRFSVCIDHSIEPTP